MDLNHIQLNTTNPEASADFYSRYFGFHKKIRNDRENGYFLWNKDGFLMSIFKIPENVQFPSWFHIGFRMDSVEEIKELYERLLKDGCKINRELKIEQDFTFFRCLDPAGYTVEVFCEPLPE